MNDIDEKDVVMIAFRHDGGIRAMVNRQATRGEVHIALGELTYRTAIELGRREVEEKMKQSKILKPKSGIMNFVRGKK